MMSGWDVLYAAGLGVTAPVWALSLVRTGKWRTDWAGRFGVGPALPGPDRPRVLLHAVSVGEVNAVRGLVAELAARGVDAVVSATTNTGFARACDLFAPGQADGGGRVVRFPLDFSLAVERMLDRVRPDVVGLVELEVWPNLVAACRRRGTPVMVINGRLSARSFRGYTRFRWALCGTFARLDAVGAQTPDYAQRFIAMGVPADRVKVLDTMKWDAAPANDIASMRALDERSQGLAQALGIDRNRPLVVAGSTGPGEPELLVEVWRAGTASGSWPAGTQLLIAPRKPEWFGSAAAAMKRAGPLVRRSRSAGDRDDTSEAAGADLFLLDTIGELRSAYAMADLAIVGRSFMGDLYGSDCMEPAAMGRATVIGPHHADFVDTVDALVAGGGLKVVNREALATEAGRLLRNRGSREAMGRAAREVVDRRRGATQRYADLLVSRIGMRGPADPLEKPGRLSGS